MLSTDFERWNKMKIQRQRDNDNNLSGEENCVILEEL